MIVTEQMTGFGELKKKFLESPEKCAVRIARENPDIPPKSIKQICGLRTGLLASMADTYKSMSRYALIVALAGAAWYAYSEYKSFTR